MPAVGLLAEPEGELLTADRGPGLSRLHLVSLAPAPGRVAARPEHLLEVLPADLVGWGDGGSGTTDSHTMGRAPAAAVLGHGPNVLGYYRDALMAGVEGRPIKAEAARAVR